MEAHQTADGKSFIVVMSKDEMQEHWEMETLIRNLKRLIVPPLTMGQKIQEQY